MLAEMTVPGGPLEICGGEREILANLTCKAADGGGKVASPWTVP